MKELKFSYPKILNWGKSYPKKGYLVRFYDETSDRYCYVADGSAVSYTGWDAVKFESFTAIAKVSSKNSDKFFIKQKILRSSSPQGNGDIDHFIELENGKILAKAVDGCEYYRVRKVLLKQIVGEILKAMATLTRAKNDPRLYRSRLSRSSRANQFRAEPRSKIRILSHKISTERCCLHQEGRYSKVACGA